MKDLLFSANSQISLLLSFLAASDKSLLCFNEAKKERKTV